VVYLRSNTVVSIEHARNSVKSESIKVEIVHPVTQIAQQKSQNLVATIVEQSAIPQLMGSLWSRMEIAGVGAIEFIQAIQHILGGVTVNHIQKHHNSKTVCSIDELFQVIGGTISAACSKEAVDLVTETCIVCMLHDRHELNDIVPQMLDSRQHILCELLVCRDPQLWGGNANVGFVYSNALGLLWSGVFEDISLGGGWVPESSIIDWRDFQVLGNIFDPRRNSLDSFARGGDQGKLPGQHRFMTAVGLEELAYLDLRVVCNGRLAIFCWNNDFKNSKGILFHGMRFSAPVV